LKEDAIFMYKGKIYVPNSGELKNIVLREMHSVPYDGHQGYEKNLIPKWKWEVVTIDFITKLPRTVKQLDSIMVVLDKLAKTAYFIPMKTTHKAVNIGENYMNKVPRLHGVPKEIV
jgi:hypothetical protein